MRMTESNSAYTTIHLAYGFTGGEREYSKNTRRFDSIYFRVKRMTQSPVLNVTKLMRKTMRFQLQMHVFCPDKIEPLNVV